MTLTPHIYLTFNGQCEAALKYYEQHLGGTIGKVFTCSGSPDAASAPPGWDAKIAHASITIGEVVIMGADMPPDRYEQPTGFQIMLALDDPAVAERVFDALAERGTITMALQQTYWAARFGVVTDRFGIPWSINCGEPQTAGPPS